jgi:hypothetical protein
MRGSAAEDGCGGAFAEEYAKMLITKIISGGQTGADRAGLDVAFLDKALFWRESHPKILGGSSEG